MNLKENELEIIFTEGGKNVVTWTGKSESKNPSAVITPYFKQILDKFKGKELLVQFEKLEYINSSTVPPIVDLVSDLDKSGVKTTITFDKNSKWQSASFKALETIVKNMKNITLKGV
ncbi:MAG: hypothetical protein JW807_10705 [Spirochaetes bacterium]|nr:hypothetical protein [Spirochaetota bacterium]